MFSISKPRRRSFHESSSGTERNSDVEDSMHLSMTKKMPGRNSSSRGKARLQRPQERSRNLVVIQEQKMFDGDLIPQAQMNEGHVLQLPNALRKGHRNDLRSKRRNNPSQLESTSFP